ncbi:hypothetical protein [Halorubrum trueperi]|uniref:Uncharacterized protein n=1 Tax=Halorubrum trueperi TaxID=2004704 RepID=A0ABD5ULR5_9EURY
MIVIDLRETWTVGPILRVLDWVIDRLVDAAVGSRFVDVAQRGVATAHAAPMRLSGICVATLGIVVAGGSLLGGVSTTRLAVGVGLAIVGLIGMQDDRDWTTLRETHPVELAIAVFAPPEPPDATDDEGKIGQSRADPNESSEPRIAADADESLSPASGSEDSAKASDSDRQ